MISISSVYSPSDIIPTVCEILRRWEGVFEQKKDQALGAKSSRLLIIWEVKFEKLV